MSLESETRKQFVKLDLLVEHLVKERDALKEKVEILNILSTTYLTEKIKWRTLAEGLAETLKKTSEPTGPYSMDHLQHAKNCLAEVIRISKEALKEYENATK